MYSQFMMHGQKNIKYLIKSDVVKRSIGLFKI